MSTRSLDRVRYYVCPVPIAVLLGVLFTLDPAPVRAQTAPDLSLRVSALARNLVGVGTEKMVLFELAWSAPRRSAGVGMAARAGGTANAVPRDDATDVGTVSYVDTESDLEPAFGSDVPLDPLERDDLGATVDGDADRGRLHAEQAQEKRTPREIPFVLTPVFVRHAIDSALSAQGISAALGRLDSLSSRARTSAMLPETRLRVGRDRDESLRLAPTTDDPYRYSQTGGVSFLIEGAVTWRLGRLLFAGEEISIERLRLAQSRERQRVTEVVLRELLTWQTAWRRVRAAEVEPNNAMEDLVETTLRLDLLTDGWFSAHQPAPTPSPQFGRASDGAKPANFPASPRGNQVPNGLRPSRQRVRLPAEAAFGAEPRPSEPGNAQRPLERMALSR